MLPRTAPCFRLAAVAAMAAKQYIARKRQHQGEGSVGEKESGTDTALWFDDTEQELMAHKQHVHSVAYRELHRPALTNAAMGLYGGEPGFEKAHRVWVDPDRPHMKHIYNQTALARNLRYARYGYFKRDMHLLDIDKLIRHARLLPTPGRLLTDFLYQRVPLSDKSCAALIRYQRQQVEMLEEWERHASFQCAVEMFERMIVTNIPPVEAGVETHGEMILCAAASRKWEEGWNIYANRARELEEESPELFVLNTFFFDAVLTLCVAEGRVKEGIDTMEEVIRRNLRPRTTMLDKAMTLCAIFAERASELENNEWYTGEEGQEHPDRYTLAEIKQTGLELWTLFDFYQLPRTTASVEVYMRMCCAFDNPTLVLKAQGFADASAIRLSIDCFYWLVYAIRGVSGFGDYIMELISQLKPRGLTPDFVFFTICFMYCALQRDGELALAIFDQHFAHQAINPTPEMVLLFIQACAHCEEPRTAMLERSELLIKRSEEVGSSVDLISSIYDQFLELCAQLGAVVSGFSAIKKIVGFGKPLTTRMINSLLLANSNAVASNGSLAMTEELVNFFIMLKIRPNADTHICVTLCTDAFGDSPVVNDFIKSMEDDFQRWSDEGRELPYDEDIPILEVPPHKLRQLRVEWKLKPRDIVLRRFGQHTKPPGKSVLDVGNMRGSVIPFGSAPGERLV